MWVAFGDLRTEDPPGLWRASDRQGWVWGSLWLSPVGLGAGVERTRGRQGDDVGGQEEWAGWNWQDLARG